MKQTVPTAASPQSELNSLSVPKNPAAIESFDALGAPAQVERPLAAGEGRINIAGKDEPFKFELGKAVNGVADLVVEAASETAKFLSSVGVAVSALIRNPKLAVAIAGVGFLGATETSEGCLRPDGSNDADYTSYGCQFQSKLLCVQGASASHGTVNMAATAIDPWNAVTSAHGALLFADVTNTITVGTGSNWTTNRGTVVPVASITIYPGFVNGSYQGPDVAVIRFAQPLQCVQPAQIAAPPAAGQTANCAGFGFTGTPSGGTFTQDGSSRAWNAVVTCCVPNNVSDQYYFSVYFGPDGTPMNGKGLNGDSGGPTYDASGKVVGIHITQDGGLGDTGDTVDLKLSETNIAHFISQNMFAPQSLKIQAQGTNVVLTWNGAGVLQSASTLNGTFSDVTGATSPYTNSIAGSPQGFFRLRPN